MRGILKIYFKGFHCRTRRVLAVYFGEYLLSNIFLGKKKEILEKKLFNIQQSNKDQGKQ